MYGSDLRSVLPQGTSQTCPSCKKRDPRNRLHCGREFAGDTVIKSTRSLHAEARGHASGARMRAALAAAR
ncbi:hypothetical protein [Streptomyces sp. NPDC002845]